MTRREQATCDAALALCDLTGTQLHHQPLSLEEMMEGFTLYHIEESDGEPTVRRLRKQKRSRRAF